MRAPESLMAPSAEGVVDGAIAGSALAPKYAEPVDRESAYELLAARLTKAPTPSRRRRRLPPSRRRRRAPRRHRTPGPAPKEQPGVVEQVVQSSAFRSALRSAGTVIGREITRSLFGTSRRRR